MHELGIVLDCKASTLSIVEIMLPMQNINNLQTKGNSTRAISLNMYINKPMSTALNWNVPIEFYVIQSMQNSLRLCVNMKHCLMELQALKLVSFELKDGSKPYHALPHNIFHLYYGTTCKEVDGLCVIGVLTKQSESVWAASAFITPKKFGTIHVALNFRRLNDMLLWKPFPLPKIDMTI